MANQGILVFRGDYGSPPNDYKKSRISDVTDDVALAGLATSLQGLTDCNICKRVFHTITRITSARPGVGANVDKVGIAYFQHPTTLRTHSFTLPGIKDENIIAKPEGDRMTEAALSTIVSGIATATGVNYTALHGVILGKR
jgi:hypothetical protein